jgi:hypothetical protein
VPYTLHEIEGFGDIVELLRWEARIGYVSNF